MESVRVRGCTTRARDNESGWLADASRRRNGPRKSVLAVTRGGGRSRCGLEVSPASSSSSDMTQDGRRVVVAGEAANPSAGGCGVEDQVGRTGSIRTTVRHPRVVLEVTMDVVVTGRHVELSDRFRSHVTEKLCPAREARPSDHPRPGGGRERTQPPSGRPRRTPRADRLLQGSGHPGRGCRRGQDERPRPGPRQDGRPDATRGRPPPRAPRTSATASPTCSTTRILVDGGPAGDESTETERQVGPITVTGEGPLVVREKTHAASAMTLDQALYEMELVGPRLLPVRRQGHRPAVRGVPAPRLRLRGHLPGPEGVVGLAQGVPIPIPPVRAMDP